MRHKFLIMDVFTQSAFKGNQLAVLPHSEGLTTEGMQAIAREFNFAETTFVQGATENDRHCRVRIFTPNAEVPFAGHPTIGTACALVHLRGADEVVDLVLEEGVGPVEVVVRRNQDGLYGMLTRRGSPEQPAHSPSTSDVAQVLSLSPGDVRAVFFASVGIPFCFVHLASEATVDRTIVDRSAWSRHLANGWSPNIFVFSGVVEPGAKLYARMFAPALGVDEDPATGSAAAALVSVLAQRSNSSEFKISIIQGVKMGRRGEIDAVAHVANGKVVSFGVGGAVRMVAAGEIDVPPRYCE